MDFRTRVEIEDSGLRIGYGDGILMLGSCFSDNIGERLRRRLMNVCVNPFGTLYNPASIAMAVERIAERRMFSAAELFEHNGMWHSFAHHSRFSSADKGKALEKINAGYGEAVASLLGCKVMVVTFGTAFVFTRGGEIVANCHKLPQRKFVRRRLGVDDIVGMWSKTIDLLGRVNNGATVIFTVSPIRHLADGMHGNQASKASLLLAVDELTRKFPQCRYFPSYEIVLDELRDYRFYAADMVHPSDVAVDYVFERFSDVCFSDATRSQAAACEKLYRMAAHRPLTDNTVEIEKFRESVRRYARELAAALPEARPQIEALTGL